MGWSPPELTVIELRFPEGDRLHGLEINLHSLTWGEAEVILERNTIEDKDFTDRLISWNVEHRVTKEPLPLEPESLKQLETGDVGRIKSAWLRAATARVPDFLESKSSNGDSSAVASLPMENL